MARKGHTEEENLRVLREAEAGETVVKLCRRHGISQQSFYLWRRSTPSWGPVSHLYRYLGGSQGYEPLFHSLGVGGVVIFFVHTSLVLLHPMDRMRPAKACFNDFMSGASFVSFRFAGCALR